MDTLSAADFDRGRLRRPGAWLVDFTAEWCPYCHRFLPMFHALDGHLEAHVALGDVTDLESPLWETFRLDTVPTVVLFENGAPVRRLDSVLGEGLASDRWAEFVRPMSRRRAG